jgi:hypothetical protein
MDNPASAPIPGYDGSASTEIQQYWLDVAWRQLQREDRSLVGRITSGDIDTATVDDVITAAARRVLRNPDGRKSENASLDDYSESWTSADPTEDLYFTAAELRRLQPATDAILDGWSGSAKYCR